MMETKKRGLCFARRSEAKSEGWGCLGNEISLIDRETKYGEVSHRITASDSSEKGLA